MDAKRPSGLYRPLDKRLGEFRVISLASTDNENGALVCALRYNSIENPPDFVALSYCCGDQSLRKAIVVDGRSITITQNCDAALRLMRNHGIFDIWVDAICIDQDTETEKNEQILRIGVIYQEASSVAVYIGPTTAEDWECITANFNTSTHDDIVARAWYQFLSQDYWYRAWIVQEIVAGVRVRVFFGPKQVPWSEIERVIRPDTSSQNTSFPHNGRHQLSIEPPPSDSFDEAAVRNQIWAICELRNQHISRTPISLLSSLLLTSRCKASLAQDKVFSMLGMSFDARSFVAEPKYSLTTDALSRGMIESVVRRSNLLDIIFLAPPCYSDDSFIPSLASRSKTPSWCRNFIAIDALSRGHVQSVIRRSDLLDIIIYSRSQYSEDSSYQFPGSGSGLPSWCPNFVTMPNNLQALSIMHYLSGRGPEGEIIAPYRAALTDPTNAYASNNLTERDDLYQFVGNSLYVSGFTLGKLDMLGAILDVPSGRIIKECEYDQAQLSSAADKICSNSDEDEDYARHEFLRLITQQWGPDDFNKNQPTKNSFRGPVDYWDFYYHFYQVLARLYKGETSVPDFIDPLSTAWLQANQDFTIRGFTSRAIVQRHDRFRSPLDWKMWAMRRAAIPGDVVGWAMKFIDMMSEADGVHGKSKQWAAQLANCQQYVASLRKTILWGEPMCRFIRLAESRYGWATPRARLGDVVALLDGCTIPAILRQVHTRPDRYVLVGNVYTSDDVMLGDTWKESNRSIMQSFVIV